MPHVDDGTLHALLDGALRAESPERAAEVEAHLAACGDCRARLDAAEELRGEASGILDAAIAEDLTATPDFTDVVRRAEARPVPGSQAGIPPGGQPGRIRRQARWTRGVAWAASLVLALGTGYLIRDLAGPAVDDVPSRAIGSEVVESASVERAPSPGPEPAADEATGRETSLSGDDEPPVGQDAAAPTEGAPTDPSSDRAPAAAPGPERRAAADAEVDAEADAESGAAVKAAEAGERVAGERAASPESLRAGALEEERLDGLVVISPTSFQSAPARWSAITVEEAREILEGPLYILPRAQLLNLYTRPDARQREVLSLQGLQSGVPIQVLQWRGEDEDSTVAADRMEAAPMAGLPTPTANGADAALPHAALPDANVVRVVRDEFVLELTGSLPEALLAVLGETADPAP